MPSITLNRLAAARRAITAVLLLCASLTATALELSPRQWSHLPTGINFAGLAYAYTEADIALDPVLELEHVEMESQLWMAKYIHSFALFDRSARIDISQGYQQADWTGNLQGSPATARRSGATDTFVRFSMNLVGAPPLEAKAFAAHRANKKEDTIVGVGLVLRLPSGDYQEDKLLNLGGNRYVLRPQIGISRQMGDFTVEATAEMSLYDENDDFYQQSSLEQDPLFIVHSHLIYSFRPGLWLSASVGYDYGGETSINGNDGDNRQQNIGWSVKTAYPLSRRLGVNLAYIGTFTQEHTGADTESLLASLAYMW